MYKKIVGARKDVFQTTALWLAILVPIVLSALFGFGISQFAAFGVFLSDMWATMKLPIAIASLSIPLATWVIANHSSARVTETLANQDRKQLSDIYFEQEKLFERILIRKIKHLNFRYITAEDLPVIHATIFDYKNLHKNGFLKIKSDLSDKIREVTEINRGNSLFFYEAFMEEKNGGNDSIKMQNLTCSYIEMLANNLMVLAGHVGCRMIRENDTSLETLCSAFVEIEHLVSEIKNFITDDIEDSFLTEDDYELFNAIMVVTAEYHGGTPAELTISKVVESTHLKVLIKHFAGSDLRRFISSVMDKVIDFVREASSHLNIVQSDEEYLALKIYHNDPSDSIKVFFTKLDDESVIGVISAEWRNEKYDINVVCEDGKYNIGPDLKEQGRFISALQYLSKTLYLTSSVGDSLHS
ncbi:hypothetical protein [Aeromonas sp. SG16]|uniref:hypothetical protein n=1 Tax=Aeromonas sp. SG16 TaxID=2950548 RepID=UPI00210CA5CD|nr:hypothetical protein [Aeromonas sp. SG16]MCQ4056294.1 hypothetical protein [Aeromonas sp. SG16]